VKDVTSHASFKPLIDIRARIYDIAHDPATRRLMTVEEAGERFAVALKPPRTAVDWRAKRLQLTA
jgi:4-hydroxyphenylacetate 3-monooxygenase